MKQFSLLTKLAVILSVMAVIAYTYKFLSLSTNVVEVKNTIPSDASLPSWELRPEKNKYSVSEDLAPDLSKPPFLRETTGLTAYVFGSIEEGAKLCQADVGKYATRVEKQDDGQWISLCDETVDTNPEDSSLLCSEYDASKGLRVFGFLTSSKNCSNQGQSIETGTYRLRTTVFTQCNSPDGMWNNIEANMCEISKEMFSKNIEITE